MKMSAFAFVGFALIATSGYACQTDLSNLGSKLPSYDRADLKQLRQMILQTDLHQALQGAQAQGLTPGQAAAAAIQQSQADDAARPQVEECVRKSAENPEEALSKLQNGTYDFNGNETIQESCATAYVLFYYQSVANKAAAVGLACLANGE